MKNIHNIPENLAHSRIWTLCKGNTKRPLISVNAPNLEKVCYTLYELPTGKSCGIITSQANEFIIIDIDAPQHIKAKVKALQEECTSSADYAGVDIVKQEIIAPLPDVLQELVQTTYTELSLSGAGLHIVAELPPNGKLQLISKAYIKSKNFDGQVSLSNNFMVMTGNKWPDSPTSIATITLDQVNEIIGRDCTKKDNGYSKKKEHVEESAQLVNDIEGSEIAFKTAVETEKLPSLAQVEHAVSILPMTQSSRLRNAYEEILGVKYEHYNYWLTIGMSLYSYGVRTNQSARAYSLYLAWSQSDPEKYVGEDDVLAKWMSFSETTDIERITYKTLMRFASLLEFEYPRVKIKDGRRTGAPLVNEYINFEYLLNRYNIRIFTAGPMNGYFLSGDEDIINKYFRLPRMINLFGYLGPFSRNQLCGSALRLCQDSKYSGVSTVSTLVDTWLTTPMEELDFFTLWLDTPFDELPEELQQIITIKGEISQNKANAFDENSNFEYLSSCIYWNGDEQDPEMSKKMLYKTFMQLIKFHETIKLPFEDNGGFLALIGPENAYKTTFFNMLLPRPLDFLKKNLTMPVASDKGLRDFMRALGTKALVQIDEFEGFLDQRKLGPVLKSVISGNDMSFTEIFQTVEMDLPRKAVIVGTSNEKKHLLSQNGSRRMWLCQVEKIDTLKLMDFNWHKFYRDMRSEFRAQVVQGKTPWLFSTAETVQISARNQKLSAKNAVDLALEELFPYSEPIDYFVNSQGSQLMTSISVRRYLSLMADMTVELPILERALERFCEGYTGTHERVQTKGKSEDMQMISHGRLHSGRSERGWVKMAWILPSREEEKIEKNL